MNWLFMNRVRLSYQDDDKVQELLNKFSWLGVSNEFLKQINSIANSRIDKTEK